MDGSVKWEDVHEFPEVIKRLHEAPDAIDISPRPKSIPTTPEEDAAVESLRQKGFYIQHRDWEEYAFTNKIFLGPLNEFYYSKLKDGNILVAQCTFCSPCVPAEMIYANESTSEYGLVNAVKDAHENDRRWTVVYGGRKYKAVLHSYEVYSPMDVDSQCLCLRFQILKDDGLWKGVYVHDCHSKHAYSGWIEDPPLAGELPGRIPTDGL